MMYHGGGGWRGGHGRLPGSLDAPEEVYGRFYDHQVAARLFRYLWPYPWQLALGSVSTLAYTLTSVALPWLVGYTIDHFIRQGDWRGLLWMVVIFLGNGVVNGIAQCFQLMSTTVMGNRALLALRRELFSHLQRLPVAFYDRNEVGRVMSRAQNDVLEIQELLTSGFLTVIADLLTLGGIVFALFWMNVPLALVTVMAIPLLILFTAVWQGRAKRAFLRVRQAIAAVNAGLQENISGVRVVQAFTREGINLQRFDRANEAHLEANVQAGRLSATLLPVVEVVTALATALVLLYGGARVISGSLEVGVLVAFILYIQRFFDPIRNLTMMYQLLQRAMVSGRRIFELLDTPAEPEPAPRSIGVMKKVAGEIAFQGVSFSYNDGAEVLHDINFHISPGERVALVGPTGAGKSTLASLILRFYQLGRGTITLDGIPLSSFTSGELRRAIAFVPQDLFLFSATVRENIRYGRPEASDAEVEEVARVVRADEFIRRLEKGYEAEVGERGARLSQGQRQLLCFARALLADPPVIILDEATASVDSQTEALIHEALGRLLEGRTAIIIAHRLSTVRFAHRIIVLDGGRVVEEGTHPELLGKGGPYAHLYQIYPQGPAAAPIPEGKR